MIKASIGKAAQGRRRRILVLMMKFSVSASLIIYVLAQSDLTKMINTLWGANFAFLLPTSILLYLIGIWIVAERTKITLGTQEIRSSLWFLVILHLKASFLTIFLPGTLGGDVYRAYSLTKQTNRRFVSLSSILVERFIGVIALLLLSLGSLFYLSLVVEIEIVPSLKAPILIVLAVSLAGTISLAMIMRSKVLGKIALPFSWWKKTREKLETMSQYLSCWRTVLRILFLSLLLHFTIVLSTYVVGEALDYSLSFYVLCGTVPLVALATMIPFSINGFGVQEASFAIFLVPLGLTVTEAVSFSLLISLIRFGMRTIGGVLFLLDFDNFELNVA